MNLRAILGAVVVVATLGNAAGARAQERDRFEGQARPLLTEDVEIVPLGGVGAVLFGWLMDRFNANRIIAVGYGLTALAVFAIGQVAGNVGLLVLVVFVAGTLMNTAQSSLPALAAGFYPTAGRASGVAWMLGIGRFGGIAGSFLVAELAARQLGFSEIFMVVAAPAVIAAIALLVKQAAHPETRTEHRVAVDAAH